MHKKENQEEGKLEHDCIFELCSKSAANMLIHNKNPDLTEKVFISVTDDGIGISKQDQLLLFKLFGKVIQKENRNKKG